MSTDHSIPYQHPEEARERIHTVMQTRRGENSQNELVFHKMEWLSPENRLFSTVQAEHGLVHRLTGVEPVENLKRLGSRQNSQPEAQPVAIAPIA